MSLHTFDTITPRRRERALAGLSRHVAERTWTTRALRQNDESLTMALEVGGVGTWDWHVPSGEMRWSVIAHRILGYVGTAGSSFESFLDLLHADDRPRVSHVMTDAMARGRSYEMQFRVIRHNHSTRWVSAKGKPSRNARSMRMLGVISDVTDHHRLEEELRELRRQVIHAHEQERSRIARELHDDVAQRVAVLTLNLKTLSKSIGSASSAIHKRMAAVASQASTLGVELQRMSHQLHSAPLEQLGLAAAIRAFCRDLSRAQQITIDVDVPQAQPVLPKAVALCAYRITQEALRNVVRHSGASSAAVTLTSTDSEMVVMVSDNGAGFDVEMTPARPSLGLRSMRERVLLVGGQLAVHSTKGEGTRVEARVPLKISQSA